MASKTNNLSDKLHSSIGRQAVDIARVSEGMQADVLRELERLESQLVKSLNDTAGKTDFTIARMRALLQQTRDTISTAYDGIATSTGASLEEIANVAASGAATAINASIGAQIVSVAMSAAQLEQIASKTLFAGAPSADWWSQQSQVLQDKFEREMRDGQFRGETVDQLVRRVRGTRDNAFKDGIMNASYNQAAALVRSSVQAVSNEARRSVYDNNRDVIKGIQHLSTLDDRTTELCISLDGLQWDFPTDGYNYADYVPVGHNKEYLPAPCHWNCRSVDIPITYSWEEMAAAHGNSTQAQLADDVPESTRASMDGQVAATMSYGEWLAQQSPEFQDEVLGPSRAAMYRSGQIGAQDLTDAAGNVLSLASLIEKYGTIPEEVAVAAKEAERVVATVDQFEEDGRFVWPERYMYGATKEVKDVAAYNELIGMEPKQFADLLTRGLELDEGKTTIKLSQSVADEFFESKNGKLTVSIKGQLKGAELNIMRTFDLRENRVDHSLFTVPKGEQGGGVGKQVLRNFMELYDRAGITRINVHANIDIGGYAWAKYGFTPYDPDWRLTAKLAQKKFEQVRHLFPEDVMKEVTRVTSIEDPEGIRELAGLKEPLDAQRVQLAIGGKLSTAETLGQYLLLGSDWEGTLDLTDPMSRDILLKYIGLKK